MAATLPQQQNESKGRNRPAASSNRSMNPKISLGNKSSNSSAQSLVYWSHSNDDEAALDDDHGGFLEFGGRAASVGLDVDDESLSQSSSFADSLYYSEDGSASRITGLVSFGSSSRDRDNASFSSGTDRYFDEEEPDGPEDPDGGDLSSLDDNVYIFTDDDSLSPRDHRLAAHESRMLVFRSSDDDRLNPPSLLETPGRRGISSSSNTSTPMIRPMPDTPSGIVSPSSWHEYNKRRGKQVARKLLSEASQNPQPKSTTGGGEPAAKKTSPPSSPLKKSLWSRGSRSAKTQSSKETSHTTQHGLQADGGFNVDRSSNPASSLSYSHESRRISLVGSWEDDDDDDDGSVRVLRCSEIDGLDARTPAHEIVERLDLGDDGRQLVDEIDAALSGSFIANAADVVHMPPFPSSLSLITFWPICNGTLWLPRYDLYVAQALRSSMSIVAA
jgi:hypothetical protein